MTSRQFFEWYNYAHLEVIGNPAFFESPDQKLKREKAEFEEGMKRLMQAQRG